MGSIDGCLVDGTAVVPIGFRCETAKIIEMCDRFKRPRLPFDWGFFTPDSIISILDYFQEYRDLDINRDSTIPTIKQYNVNKNGKFGIEFKRSTHQEIDEHIKNKGYDNSYICTEKSYYTLLEDFGFVIAHYIWHPTAQKLNADIAENLKNLESIIIRRLERLFDLIDNADRIILAYHNHQNFDFMWIDNEEYNLDPEPILNKFKTMHDDVILCGATEIEQYI